MEWLGKKGRVTDLLKGLGQLSAEERPKAGAEINAVKQLLERFDFERKERHAAAGCDCRAAGERES